jgi:hypothetical protein
MRRMWRKTLIYRHDRDDLASNLFLVIMLLCPLNSDNKNYRTQHRNVITSISLDSDLLSLPSTRFLRFCPLGIFYTPGSGS